MNEHQSSNTSIPIIQKIIPEILQFPHISYQKQILPTPTKKISIISKNTAVDDFQLYQLLIQNFLSSSMPQKSSQSYLIPKQLILAKVTFFYKNSELFTSGNHKLLNSRLFNSRKESNTTERLNSTHSKNSLNKNYLN